VTLGAFAAFQIYANTGSLQGAAMGLDGAMVQMISHGLISGALFLCSACSTTGCTAARSRTTAGHQHEPCSGRSWCCSPWQTRDCPAPRVRGRVPGDPGELPRELLVRVPRGDDAHSRRGLHTVAGQARRVRARRQRSVAALEDLNRREFLVLGVLAVAVLALGLWRRRCST